MKQEQSAKRAKAVDVTATRCLLVDFDPRKTEMDPEGVDPESREAARSAATAAHKLFGGVLVDSGRGHQLWVIHEPEVDRAAFLRACAVKWDSARVKVDATHDAARLARMPGTVNTRTGQEARIVS